MTARIVRCEHCDQLLQFTDAQRKIRCHVCGKTTTVPKALAEMPHPILPGETDDGRLAAAHVTVPEEPHMEEEFPEPSAFARKVANCVPWVVSVSANVSVMLVLALLALFVGHTLPAEPLRTPTTSLRDTPPGRMNPDQSHEDQSSRRARLTKTRKFSPKEKLVVDSHRSGERVALIGAATGMPPSGGSPLGLDNIDGGPPGGPEFMGGPSGRGAHHIVWVIDRSGSLAQNFTVLKQEMLLSVRKLKLSQDFHVILFGEDAPVEKEPKKLTAASEKNILAVADFLAEVRSASGYTKPIAALERAFTVLKQADRSRPGKLIYLLTDGVFPNNDEVVARLRALNKTKGVQINTYLYASDRNELAEGVMRKIAAENGGQYKYVSPDELD
ncbi:MAG: vWA domain-containing protein [Planctomycetota bacterium]|jgi:hypothetical protein